jgi:chromosome segregation ATPase
LEQEARTQVSKASSTASSRLESATSTKQEIGALKRKREACRNEYGSTSRWHPFRRRDLKGELDRIAEDIDEKTKDADEAVEAVTQANADKQKAETEKSDAYAEVSKIRDRAAAANKETVATAKMHAAAHVNAAEAQAMALLKEADSLQAKADMAFEALTRARTEAGLHLMDAFSTLRALEAVAADLKPLQATRRRLEKLGARITVAASVTGRESLAAVLR